MAITGRKSSWPVAPAAVRMPITRPRRATNQRLAIVAAKTMAIEPVPTPISSPQVSISCQPSRTRTVSPLPAATSSRATLVTRRMPKRSIRAAANGAITPYRTRLTLTAPDIRVRDQPNSSSSGTISTPGAARKPAAPSSAMKGHRRDRPGRVQAAPRRRRAGRGVGDDGGGAGGVHACLRARVGSRRRPRRRRCWLGHGRRAAASAARTFPARSRRIGATPASRAWPRPRPPGYRDQGGRPPQPAAREARHGRGVHPVSHRPRRRRRLRGRLRRGRSRAGRVALLHRLRADPPHERADRPGADRR